MKKLAALLFTFCTLTATIKPKNPEINKSTEFIKGMGAFAMAAGLGYLAYKAPIDEMHNYINKLANNQNEGNEFINFLELQGARFARFTKVNIFGQFDNKKLFSFLTIIPAYEILKYSIRKLGNSMQSTQKDEYYLEKKRRLKTKNKLATNN